MKQFTNEATQQMLADFDKSPFSDADLAAMDVVFLSASARHALGRAA